MQPEILHRLVPKLGMTMPKTAKILDYGCGAGRTVYKLLDQGYTNVCGYDVMDYLHLRGPADRSRFHIGSRSDSGLPFEDNTFDFVLSDQVFEHVLDQVHAFRELHRVTAPGGVGLHLIPARYNPIEGHIFVPLGGIIAHRWWYKLWALAGIRNGFQANLSADETADRNAFYFVEALNYVPSSFYKVVWKKLGFEYRFVHQEFFDSHPRATARTVGKLNRVLPLVGWMYCTMRARLVYLRKPSE